MRKLVKKHVKLTILVIRKKSPHRKQLKKYEAESIVEVQN